MEYRNAGGRGTALDILDLARRWAALLLGSALLATGCVTPATVHRPFSLASTEPGRQARLYQHRSPTGSGTGSLERRGETPSHEGTRAEPVTQGPASCGGVAVPLDWPDFSSADAAALLAPFLACTSPAEFVALQQQVDMPRLMESLDDWSAVRLGTLGPVREDAAPLLQRKRAAFLLSATERYGLFQAEVFALFVLHSAHDDEVNEVLRLLARDKQLVQTLGHMPAVREELEQRGLSLSRHPARAEQAGDVLRGLGRAAGDALATSPTSDGARYLELSSHRAQLPPPYQQALDEVQRALALRHFSADSVALGSFDHLTFGMPLGCFYLVAGTGQGLASLSQGQYEQATRELAPAMLLGALYVGGKGLRPLSQTRGAPGVALHWKALQERGRQLEARLGVDGLRELARHIQASREAGRFVAVGGVDAALALHEARGNVARAQAWLSKARHEATSSASRGLASLVDAQAGLTPEVVQARLAAVELEAAGPRLPGSVAALEKQRPSVDAPPPGAEGSPRWGEYVAYYERRLGELQEGTASKGPLRWDAYEQMRGWFARGVAFERLMVKVLRADAELPRAQRRFLGDFDRPRIETYVGVKKPGAGLCYADVLVIETDGWARAPPRVETFSFKSRNLSLLDEKALEVQMTADANEALLKYGGTLDIRRSSLQFLFHTGTEASVQRIRLVYEGDMLKPKDVEMLKRALDATEYALPEVEVLFQ